MTTDPRLGLALSVSLLAAVACESATSPPGGSAVVESVEITAAAAELSPGERHRFSADALDGDGAPIPGAELEWSSTNPSVAVVDDDGLVTAAGNGSAEIRAAAGDHVASATVTVVTSWSAITAGYDHACGLTPGGAAFCWGSNESGQLGIGIVGGSSPVPVAVTGGLTWKAISAGRRHSCAVSLSDELWCWGRNGNAEVGGSEVSEPAPRLVAIEAPVGTVRAGNEHSCAVSTGATAYCWGANNHGQVGNGEILGNLAPSEVTGSHAWQLVDANGSGMTCGLDLGGKAWCWGSGYLGQTSNTGDSPVPLEVATDLVFETLGTFFNGACGLAAGKPYCWGQNTRGALGTGNTEDAALPVPASTTQTFAQLSVGATHACALTPGHRAFCWGENVRGEAGSVPAGGCGTFHCVPTPTAVAGDHEFSAISAGEFLTCAMTSGGAGYCWGSGASGQLGSGGLDDTSVPVRVAHPPGDAGE